MDLFDYMRETKKEKESPLASRMRPKTLDEVVGQQHIIGKDKLLYRAIKADKLSSVIFYGPPGTGKTTDFIAERSMDICYDMPHSYQALIGDTYTNILKNIAYKNII